MWQISSSSRVGSSKSVSSARCEVGRLSGVRCRVLTCDQRFLCQYDLLGCGGIRAEQPPVNEASVPEVRVLALLSSEGQNLLDQLLGVGGSLQEQLHNRGQQLELDLTILVMEVL